MFLSLLKTYDDVAAVVLKIYLLDQYLMRAAIY